MLHLSNLQFFSAEIAGIISRIRALRNQIIRSTVTAAADTFSFRNRHPFFVAFPCIVRRTVTLRRLDKRTGRGFRRGAILVRVRPVGNCGFRLFRFWRPAGLLLLGGRFVRHRRLIGRSRRPIQYRRRRGALGALLSPLPVLPGIPESPDNHDKYNKFKKQSKHMDSPQYKMNRKLSIF